MAVQLFITGGTIDSVTYHSEKEGRRFTRTYIPEMLEQARITVPVRTKKLMIKDSRFLTERDLEKILSACKKSKDKAIVITHGTMTMENTAQYLGGGNKK